MSAHSAQAATAKSSAMSSPRVVSMPQNKKIIQDLQDCIKQLKEDFTENKAPINDDNQTLHRFCAKLEYLLQAHMKERYSMLGRKKDYWDYIVDCLGSTKGINDGIKYVKSLGEHKTSLGKGRAFLRFSLVHQRLPDTIQQCVQNPKTGEWFQPASVWYQKGLTGDLVNSLYDLTDIHFDLSPRGYDLDTAWPSFAKKQGGNFSWNPPSRRSSISSMASITMQDTSSLLSVPLSYDNSGEMDKLTQDLETSESVRSQLMEQVGSLQQEKMAVTQSAWSTQGELNAVQDQLRDLQEQHTELQDRYLKLEKRHDKMCVENTSSEKEWYAKEEELANQLQALLGQRKEADDQLLQVKEQLDKVRQDMANNFETFKSEKEKLETEKVELSIQIKALEKEIKLLKESEEKKMEEIRTLELKLKAKEEKNSELLTKLQLSLESKESDASSQMDAANKLHEVVARLKEVELSNVKLQAENENLEKKCENFEKEVISLKTVKTELSEELTKGKEEAEEVKRKLKDLEECSASDVRSLNSELKKKQEEIEEKNLEIENLSSQVSELNLKSLEMDSMITQSFNQWNLLAGGGDELDGNNIEFDKFISDITSLKDKISERISSMEDEVRRLTSEKGRLEQEFGKLAEEKEQVIDNLDDLRKAFGEFQQGQQDHQRDLDLKQHETESELRQMEVELTKKKEEIEEMAGRLLEQKNQVVQVLSDCNLKQDQTSDVSQLLLAISLHMQKLSTRVTDMEGEKNILEGKLAHLQAGDTDKGTQLQHLEEQFSLLQKSLGAARELEAKLRSDLSEKEKLLKDECAKSNQISTDLKIREEEVMKLSEQFAEAKSENVSLREQVATLNHDLGDLRVTMATTAEKLQTSSEIKDKDKERFEEVLKLKEKELKDKDELIKTIEGQKNDYKKELLGVNKEKSKLEKEKVKLDKELQKIRTSLEQSESENSKLQSDYQKEQRSKQEMEERMKSQQQEYAVLKQSLEDAEAEMKSKEKKYSEMLESHETKQNHLTARLEEALADTQQIQTQLRETSAELEQACSLKERAEQEKEEVTAILKNLEASYKELKTKLNLFEQEGQEIVSAKESFEKECAELKSEAESLRTKLKQVELERSSSSSEKEKLIGDLKSELDETTKKLSQFQVSVESLESDKISLLEQMRATGEEKENLKQTVEELKNSMEEAEKKNEDLLKTVERLDLNVKELENSLEEKSRRCEELEASSGEQSNLKLTVESLNQEISALQFQLSAEQMQHEESLRNFTSKEDEEIQLQNKLLEQEAVISQLEQEVASVQGSQKQEVEKQKQELENLASKLSTTIDENKLLTERLEQLETEFTNEQDVKDKLQSELTKIQERHSEEIKEKEEEVVGLKSDNKQLKKQLLKLIRDKDTLWQKTDQLTYQQKVQAKDTWMDNNTATNCLKCKSEFSIWLRRHHCRQCGKIYCWKCVDNWVMTAHSSKKERVCDECYSHKQSLESDTNTSVLSTNSGSDDEDEDFLRLLTLRGSSQSTDDRSSTHGSEMTGESDTGSQILQAPPGSPNATDEHKAKKMQSNSPGPQVEASGSMTPEREDPFHVITDEEVTKSLTVYESDVVNTPLSPNMCSSMILSAEELEKGEINSQNEVWVKPGKSYMVPIVIDTENTELWWEFTSQPKDIVFSVTYRENDSSPVSEAEELIQPCKCDSHKQAVQGTLTAKQTGLYSLVFDNTYSRMTAKKVHYSLQSRSTS